VGALAFKIAAPGYRATQEYKESSYTTFQNALVWKVGVQPLYVLAISRAIMILLLMAVYLFCFYYARRIFGIWPSFLGFLIISLDPFFIALTRMSHLDAPQAVFMFLSILAFLSYLYRGNRWFDLIISGGAGGLAFLSKLPGLFIIPTIGLVAIWDWLVTRKRNKITLSIFADKSILKLFKPLLIWALVFVITYSAFWPSMWIQPAQTIAKVFGTSAKYSSTIIEEGKSEQEDETSTISNRTLADYFRYPETFLWRTTPIVLLGLVLLLITTFFRRGNNIDETFTSGVQGLLIFLAVYTIGITLPAKSSEKYYAPAYLILDLLAGIGWHSFVSDLTRDLRENARKYLRFGILVTVLLIQSIWVFQSFPYYFSYYNPLLGGIKQAAQIRFIGVGEGLDQAGLYLIQKSGSSDLKVMSWYGTGPLSYFFDGHVTPLYMSNSAWTPEFIQKLNEMDYLVIYTNQKFRNQPPELFALLSGIAPEYTVTIDGAEYAWIYKVSDIPLPGS
jgi:4-amino-4-deoxy-L-arabinose transferase-like glycosyltransferase